MFDLNGEKKLVLGNLGHLMEQLTRFHYFTLQGCGVRDGPGLGRGTNGYLNMCELHMS